MPEVSEANAPADPLNAAIEKAAGPVASQQHKSVPLNPIDLGPPKEPGISVAEQERRVAAEESEPAALVPEGVAAADYAFPAGSLTGQIEVSPAQEEALKAKAAAIEAYIQAGIDKVAAAVGQTEIVTVAAFKLAVEALLRHLHQDHPENYL